MELGEHRQDEPPVPDCDCRRCAVATRDDLRKDAERYRWLRNEAVWAGSPKGEGGEMCWVVIGTDAYRSHPVDGVELDEAVDAAMQGANV